MCGASPVCESGSAAPIPSKKETQDVTGGEEEKREEETHLEDYHLKCSRLKRLCPCELNLQQRQGPGAGFNHLRVRAWELQ